MRHLATRLLQICFYCPLADSKKVCFLVLFLAQRGFPPGTPVHLSLKTHTSQLQFGLEPHGHFSTISTELVSAALVNKLQCNFFPKF